MHSNSNNYQGHGQSGGSGNYNELNFFSRSSSRGPSYSVSSSSLVSHHSALEPSSNYSETLLRRENEIERLKNKVALLEGRINSSTAGDAKPVVDRNPMWSSDSNRSNDEISERLKQLDVERSLLYKEHETRKIREKELTTLEQLLNQREYEIEELKRQLKEETTKRSNDTSRYSTMATQKDEEIVSLKTSNSNMQRELEKAQTKLKNYNDYISSLPTPEDVKQTDKISHISDLKSQIESLNSQLAESERKVLRAKHYMKEKMAEVKSKEETIEELIASRERIEIEYQEYKDASKSVGELIKRCEENAGLVAELECARKLIKNQEDKIRRMIAKNEETVLELEKKLGVESEQTQKLRSELSVKEQTITDLHGQIKLLNDEKQRLLDANSKMSEQIKGFDSIMSSELKKLLQEMFKELNNCTGELNDLVSNCLDLHNGVQVDVNRLLGFGVQLANIDISNSNSTTGIINADYLTKKINEIKQLRSRLRDVRTKITDKYADTLGDNISCIQS